MHNTSAFAKLGLIRGCCLVAKGLYDFRKDDMLVANKKFVKYFFDQINIGSIMAPCSFSVKENNCFIGGGHPRGWERVSTRVGKGIHEGGKGHPRDIYEGGKGHLRGRERVSTRVGKGIHEGGKGYPRGRERASTRAGKGIYEGGKGHL
ncbi:10106_t:CDS:2 [Cetraspora pellucida]|uniref:10106_t:CDS:1 n=1 Tax=Cetraspora pellucida TaxID=1433469 RepID=A0A9N9I5Q9_9GLOM|nr:10106_t:CDS:2 [Cetraspora pellucida]